MSFFSSLNPVSGVADSSDSPGDPRLLGVCPFQVRTRAQFQCLRPTNNGKRLPAVDPPLYKFISFDPLSMFVPRRMMKLLSCNALATGIVLIHISVSWLCIFLLVNPFCFSLKLSSVALLFLRVSRSVWCSSTANEPLVQVSNTSRRTCCSEVMGVSNQCVDSSRDCKGECLLRYLGRPCVSNETTRIRTGKRNTHAEPIKSRSRITKAIYRVTGPSISDLHRSFGRMRSC